MIQEQVNHVREKVTRTNIAATLVLRVSSYCPEKRWGRGKRELEWNGCHSLHISTDHQCLNWHVSVAHTCDLHPQALVELSMLIWRKRFHLVKAAASAASASEVPNYQNAHECAAGVSSGHMAEH